jgi:hypothetical protein
MARIRVETSHTTLELAVSTDFRRSIWQKSPAMGMQAQSG